MINSSAVASILYIIFTFAIVSISSFVTHDKCHHNIAKLSPITVNNIPSTTSCPLLTSLQSHHNIHPVSSTYPSNSLLTSLHSHNLHLVSLPYSDTDSNDDVDDNNSRVLTITAAAGSIESIDGGLRQQSSTKPLVTSEDVPLNLPDIDEPSNDNDILLKKCWQWKNSITGDMSKKRNHKGKNQNRRRSGTGRLESNRNKASTQDSTSCGRIKTLLDTALTAGKKARNEVATPEISGLKEYTKDDMMPPESNRELPSLEEYSKDDMMPPDEIMLPIIDAVMDRAIKPSVTKCIKRLESFENGSSSQITSLRMQVYAIVDALTEQHNARSDDMRKKQLKRLANKLLHQPTMQLRQEKLSDIELEDIILQIELRLKERAGLGNALLTFKK